MADCATRCSLETRELDGILNLLTVADNYVPIIPREPRLEVDKFGFGNEVENIVWFEDEGFGWGYIGGRWLCPDGFACAVGCSKTQLKVRL